MEHPLITNISDLTEEELSDKIAELTKKYMIAQRTGNGHVCGQISMAIETYRNKLQEKYRAQIQKGGDHEDKIDIS